MQVQVIECVGLKNASAGVRDGVLEVKLPRTWPKHEKARAVDILVAKVMKRVAKEQALLHTIADPRVTITDVAALRDYVNAVNASTFQTPDLKGVRIGQAKYSRLAQVNVKTGIITVSKYCLENVPEPALRYLIVHELAHFYVRGHSARFWALVSQFVPQLKRQMDTIQAHHRAAVAQG